MNDHSVIALGCRIVVHALKIILKRLFFMDLAEGFRNHREKIVNRWLEYTLSTYGSSAFFLKQRDKFANPIGGNFREALDQLFGLISTGKDSKEFHPPLETLISIRSVQEFSPSQAIAPINALKHITREVLSGDKERSHLVAELYDFEFAIDLAMLAAFDIYMQCRERLYKVRINEIKSGRSRVTDGGCPSRLLSDKDSILK